MTLCVFFKHFLSNLHGFCCFGITFKSPQSLVTRSWWYSNNNLKVLHRDEFSSMGLRDKQENCRFCFFPPEITFYLRYAWKRRTSVLSFKSFCPDQCSHHSQEIQRQTDKKWTQSCRYAVYQKQWALNFRLAIRIVNLQLFNVLLYQESRRFVLFCCLTVQDSPLHAPSDLSFPIQPLCCANSQWAVTGTVWACKATHTHTQDMA